MSILPAGVNWPRSQREWRELIRSLLIAFQNSGDADTFEVRSGADYLDLRTPDGTVWEVRVIKRRRKVRCPT